MKALVVSSCLLLVVNFMIVGCGSEDATNRNSTSSSISTNNTGSSPIPTSPDTSSQIIFSPLPKLNEEAQVTFVPSYSEEYSRQNAEKLSKAKAWLDFYWTDIHGSYSEAKKSTLVPLSEVLVGGQPTWEGNALDRVGLLYKIKLPKEGVWRVAGTLAESDTSKPLVMGNEWIAVADGTASRLHDYEIEKGPLAYLANFPYGEVGEKQLDEVLRPVIMVLNIAKAPRAGEAVPVTRTLTSLHDVADFSMLYKFMKRGEDGQTNDISNSGLLKDGDLAWQGNLKAKEPVVVSATIQFPEPGDWSIVVEGNSKANEENHLGRYSDYLDLNMTAERGSFGWLTR
jgi:hypothetical protein